MSRLAAVVFDTIHFFTRSRPRPSFTPKWSDKPLLKSWERSMPKLGWPRETDSLCPQCVIEAREAIIAGERDYKDLMHEKIGEVKAQIVERDGQVWMIKECPEHGRCEDIIAIDSEFLEHIEANFPGRDIRAHSDEDLHRHGSSTVKYGRGSVLTVDLTNRCNMMCDPCFMDANQVGFVHELQWDDIKEILDNALKIKPRRQMSVQFSGGEPTISPYFIQAVKYARDIGYNSVQAATNGIRFAQDPEFAKAAADAGLRFVYLQFDGVGNEANSHRHISNLFDVKLKAIHNLYEAGVQIVLVTTLVNNLNNDQVGPIIRFALDNPKKIAFIAFQPVSFTGRDEAVTEERRLRQRYTLSHMAYDVKRQVGITEPRRDWFPISAFQTFADFADLSHGPEADWGQTSCGCHPNCGIGTAVMVNKNTKEFAPVPEFLNVPQLLADTTKVNDQARSKRFSNLMMALALLKNYNPYGAPPSLTLFDILKKFDKTFGLSGHDYGSVTPDGAWERRKDPWNFLFIAGMWFQDLFNYDFRRTEMCVIPYGTQEGEISFCAYNTGIGWRNILEHMYKNATVAEWFRDHGKHRVYAGNHEVDLPDVEHALEINQEDASRGRELADDVAHFAHQERLLARKRARATGEERAAQATDDARIASVAREYYEEMVLKRPKKSNGHEVRFDLPSRQPSSPDGSGTRD
ncbi:MAG: radical SAM protein [Candidatus Eiseniibacteriota bacterium]